jgi:hypothetical protein
MKHSGSFTHDLSFGEESEDWVKSLFIGKFKVEVKSDRRALVTGNLYIEVYSRSKPSGISTTDADYWIYKIEGIDTTIIIPTSRLKELVRAHHKGLFKHGGDHDSSRGVLIPIKEIFKNE